MNDSLVEFSDEQIQEMTTWSKEQLERWFESKDAIFLTNTFGLMQSRIEIKKDSGKELSLFEDRLLNWTTKRSGVGLDEARKMIDKTPKTLVNADKVIEEQDKLMEEIRDEIRKAEEEEEEFTRKLDEEDLRMDVMLGKLEEEMVKMSERLRGSSSSAGNTGD
eukprot:g1237.t1